MPSSWLAGIDPYPLDFILSHSSLVDDYLFESVDWLLDPSFLGILFLPSLLSLCISNFIGLTVLFFQLPFHTDWYISEAI
jgi:hypothetical protein